MVSSTDNCRVQLAAAGRLREGWFLYKDVGLRKNTEPASEGGSAPRLNDFSGEREKYQEFSRRPLQHLRLLFDTQTC